MKWIIKFMLKLNLYLAVYIAGYNVKITQINTKLKLNSLEKN